MTICGMIYRELVENSEKLKKRREEARKAGDASYDFPVTDVYVHISARDALDIFADAEIYEILRVAADRKPLLCCRQSE